MLKNLYSIYDRTAQFHMPPFIAHNNESAIRDFSQTATNPDLPLSKSPTDFVLIYIGKFNDSTGKLEPAVQNETIAEAANYFKQKD